MLSPNGTTRVPEVTGTTEYLAVGRVLYVAPTHTWGHAEDVTTGEVFFWHVADRGMVFPSFGHAKHQLVVWDPAWKDPEPLQKLDIIRFIPGMAPRGPRAILWVPAAEYRDWDCASRTYLNILKHYRPLGMFR